MARALSKAGLDNSAQSLLCRPYNNYSYTIIVEIYASNERGLTWWSWGWKNQRPRYEDIFCLAGGRSIHSPLWKGRHLLEEERPRKRSGSIVDNRRFSPVCETWLWKPDGFGFGEMRSCGVFTRLNPGWSSQQMKWGAISSDRKIHKNWGNFPKRERWEIIFGLLETLPGSEKHFI